MSYKQLNRAVTTISVTLGELLEKLDIRDGDIINKNDIEGVNVNKTFAPTVANLENTDLSRYKSVPPDTFAANLMHIGRDMVIPVALNTSAVTKFVSPAYCVFKVKDTNRVLPLFLMMLFSTSSMDRLVWFTTDSSVRGNLSWNDLCRVNISLPTIEVQQAYVNAYKGLTALIDENEKLFKSLEAMAQASVLECREKWPMVTLGSYLLESNERNVESKLSFNDVRGISTDKIFIDTKANLNGVKLSSYKIVKPKSFAFVPDTSRRGDKIAIAFNSSEKQYLVSAIYIVYKISNSDVLLPEYLHLQFNRTEFDRYARFNSWGSARESFGFDDMCRVKIPLPPIEVQQSIVALFHCAEEARKIAEEAKAQLAKLCPAMIQRAAHCH